MTATEPLPDKAAYLNEDPAYRVFVDTLSYLDQGEIELVIDAGDRPCEEHEVPEIEPGPAICQPGDLWQLGRHRLVLESGDQPCQCVRALETAMCAP